MVETQYKKQVQLREHRHCNGGSEPRPTSPVLGSVSQTLSLPVRELVAHERRSH